MSPTQKILKKLAKKYNINDTQAYEILNLIGKQVVEEMVDDNKKTDNLYDIEKFKAFRISHFGVFQPCKRTIEKANYWIKKKYESKE